MANWTERDMIYNGPTNFLPWPAMGWAQAHRPVALRRCCAAAGGGMWRKEIPMPPTQRSLTRSLSACALVAALLLVPSVRPMHAGGVVGNGTPASCTEAAFDAALASGGTILSLAAVRPSPPTSAAPNGQWMGTATAAPATTPGRWSMGRRWRWCICRWCGGSAALMSQLPSERCFRYTGAI